jgi:hypothetical protein
MQSTLLPIYVDHETDSTLGGSDLKRIAKADDGHTYAVKRKTRRTSDRIDFVKRWL